jgi:hypothetical protein
MFTHRSSTFRRDWNRRKELSLASNVRLMFASTSFVYHLWNAWMLVLLLYSVIAIAFRVAFLFDLTATEAMCQVLLTWHIIEYVIDLCWGLDMYLKAYRFGYMEMGVEIRDPVDVYRNYRANGGMWSDLVLL